MTDNINNKQKIGRKHNTARMMQWGKMHTWYTLVVVVYDGMEYTAQCWCAIPGTRQ